MQRRRGWFLLFWILTSGHGLLWADPNEEEPWKEERSDHFRVFYKEDSAFASAVARHAEQAYSRIVLDLGLHHVVKRDRILWLWDKRCQIHLYSSRSAYLQATGAPPWSGGKVNYRERRIYSFREAESLLESILPHELAHLLFREYVGFENERVPLWLDEGVAQYSEEGRRTEALSLMREWLKQGVYIPFEDLGRMGTHPLSGEVARLYYAQAVSMVHFFLPQYGSRRFIEFCSNLRDGYTVDRALSFATSSAVSSMKGLEEGWKRFLILTAP